MSLFSSTIIFAKSPREKSFKNFIALLSIIFPDFSAICLICFACTFLLMPISNYVPIEYSRISAMVIGIVFWLTGIIGYSLLFVLYRNIKGKKKRRIYIFANRITIIADIVFLLGIICGILVLSLKIASTYFGYITIFILVLSLNVHLIFSRNYLRKLERKRGGFDK